MTPAFPALVENDDENMVPKTPLPNPDCVYTIAAKDVYTLIGARTNDNCAGVPPSVIATLFKFPLLAGSWMVLLAAEGEGLTIVYGPLPWNTLERSAASTAE